MWSGLKGEFVENQRYTDSLWPLDLLYLTPEVSFTGGIFRRLKSVASNPNDIAGVPTHSMWHSRALCSGTHPQHVTLAVEITSIMSKMNLLRHRLLFFSLTVFNSLKDEHTLK